MFYFVYHHFGRKLPDWNSWTPYHEWAPWSPFPWFRFPSGQVAFVFYFVTCREMRSAEAAVQDKQSSQAINLLYGQFLSGRNKLKQSLQEISVHTVSTHVSFPAASGSVSSTLWCLKPSCPAYSHYSPLKPTDGSRQQGPAVLLISIKIRCGQLQTLCGVI